MTEWNSPAPADPTGQGVTPDNHRASHERLAANVRQLREIADAREAIRTKVPVRVATLVAGTLATDYAVGKTVDGVTLALNDRILIKDLGTAANGIYVVTNGAPKRASDADTSIELAGAVVTVMEGSQAGVTYVQIDPAPVLGTTVLTWLRSLIMVRISQAGYDGLSSAYKTANSGILFAVTS